SRNLHRSTLLRYRVRRYRLRLPCKCFGFRMIGDEVSQRLGQNTEPCSRSSFQSLCRRLPDSEQCGTVRWRFSDGAIRTMEAQFWREEHEIRAAPRIPEPRRTCPVGYQCNPVPMAKEL